MSLSWKIASPCEASGTPGLLKLNVVPGSGHDAIHVGTQANTLSPSSEILIDGGGGFAFDAITLNDHGTVVPRAYNFGGVLLIRLL